MGESRKLWIEGPAGKLEAALRLSDPPRACAAIAHPHPLYGGTLHNPVIFHVDRELNRIGLTTLRFNFRGVEGSEGTHDDGGGEVDDVAAAARWVRALAPGGPMLLVGYSFGSRCAIDHALSDPAVAGVVAIGLPVRLWPFTEIERLGRPLAVVHGTRDQFGSIEEITSLLARASPPGQLYAVPGATHPFPAQAQEAALAVARAVEEMLQALPRTAASA